MEYYSHFASVAEYRLMVAIDIRSPTLLSQDANVSRVCVCLCVSFVRSAPKPGERNSQTVDRSALL